MHGMICRLLLVMFLSMVAFQSLAKDKPTQEGIESLKRYKRYKDFQVSQGDLQDYLQDAFNSFAESKSPESMLFLLYTAQHLKRETELEDDLIQFVVQHRSEYIDMIADLDLLTMKEKVDLKDKLLALEQKIPFIDDIHLKSSTIYPYRNQKPEIMFFLSSQATMTLYIDGDLEQQKECLRAGYSFGLNWENRYLDKNQLAWRLQAEGPSVNGNESGLILLKTTVPESLSLENGKFMIDGLQPKPESRSLKIRNGKTLSYGILGSLGVGALATLIKRDNETGYEYSKNERMAIGIVTAAIGVGLTIYFYLTSVKKKEVPIKENIDFNQKLYEKLSELKKQIHVQMELKRD